MLLQKNYKKRKINKREAEKEYRFCAIPMSIQFDGRSQLMLRQQQHQQQQQKRAFRLLANIITKTLHIYPRMIANLHFLLFMLQLATHIRILY